MFGIKMIVMFSFNSTKLIISSYIFLSNFLVKGNYSFNICSKNQPRLVISPYMGIRGVT